MRNIFLDEQSRKGSKGRIVGRGFAMTTAASEVICYGCNETGHIRRHCRNPKLKERKKSKPAGATKWCSIHNTTTHSDEECYKQGAKRPEQAKDTSKAFPACSRCAHRSSSSSKKEVSSEKTAIDFTHDGDDFDSGFMFTTCSPGRRRDFAVRTREAALLVDTGA